MTVLKNKMQVPTRRIDYSWDFKGAKTKAHTHGLHMYPAMFIPQVASRLITAYSKQGDTICDIFCGSGTALVEGRLASRNCYGIDLNPFAVFLAKVKTTPLKHKDLVISFESILGEISKLESTRVATPEFNNIAFWFKPDVINKLAIVLAAIKTIKNNEIRNFFLVSFSATVRKASNTKPDEFKLVRISPNSLMLHDPDVFTIFCDITEKNLRAIASFSADVDKNTFSKIISGDSSLDVGIPADSVDLIVTSPPYGDSRTTVAYGQFSRLSTQWLGIMDNPNDAAGVDNSLLGGRATTAKVSDLHSDHLAETIAEISKKDSKRANDVLSFYVGLNACILQARHILKKNKYFCLVVGNRLVKQVRIPTDYIVAELASAVGFKCEDIFIRNIPSKRMPLKTSPTNIPGKLEDTMTKESIVVLKRVK